MSTAQLDATRLQERRHRLADLQQELAALPGAIGRTQEALSRAIVDGQSEEEQRRIRVQLADQEARANGLRQAIELVRRELAPLEQAEQATVREDLEAEADELEEAAHEAQREAERELLRLAADFARTYAGVRDRYTKAREVRREALRAAGAHAEDVYRAEPRYRLPVLGDQGRQTEYGHVSRTLAGYAEWAARRGLDRS